MDEVDVEPDNDSGGSGGSVDDEFLPEDIEDDGLPDIDDLPQLDTHELNGWQLRLLVDPETVRFTLLAPTTDDASAEFDHLLKSLVSGTKAKDYHPKDSSVSCLISDPKALLSCLPPFRM